MNYRPGLLKALLIGACLLATHAQGGVTSIADTPLIIATPSSVQPNLMFVLDDSGSMNFDFLPDHINGDGSPDRKVCRSAGATSATATGSFGAGCCTNNDESTACWTGTAPFTYRGHPPFLAASFNGLAYNPAIRYLPPVNYQGTSAGSITSFTSVKNDYYNVQNTGSINLTTQFPDLEWCTDSNYTDCLRNGNYVLPGTVNAKSYTTAHATTATGSGYKAMGAPEAAGAVAQDWGPYYYNIIPNEYCDGPNLRNCQVGQGGNFTYAAPVRWCTTQANAIAQTPAANSCQATRTASYTYARYPTTYPSVATGGSPYVPATPGSAAVPARATVSISLSGCTSTKTAQITGFSVNGVNEMSGSTASERTASNLASDLAGAITRNNYSATVSGSTVTVSAPTSAGNLTVTPAVTSSTNSTACVVTLTVSAFSGYQAAVASTPAVPATAGTTAARFERVDIIPANNSYPKAASRTDCAGSTCTYNEEMSNFANWWTYYHSRMQMMKTSLTLAFNSVPNTYRVGYMTINNSQGSAFLNLTTFGTNSTARQNWWTKLQAAKPANSTPLRSALATIGRLYGGKYNSSSINGVSVVDPVQYSCQKNFLLLSTDGFWNESNNPKQLDGSTDIGDQDSTLSRPMKDGNNVTNTLADTAAYYYNTDLRTGTTGTTACKSGDPNMSNSDVCGNGTDNSMQRMFTYTLGLGASGYMQFQRNYSTATSGDYYSVAQGLTPSSSVCIWQSSGTCTWPSPVSNTLTTIDDLWHAAVNGGGTYFSATDPAQLYTGLTDALSAIDQRTGAAAAVTTSAPNITATDNQAFVSTFRSGDWSGELQSRRISVNTTNTGAVSSSADWSAKTLLNANTSRNIFMYSATGTRNRRTFSWDNLTTTEQGYFSKSTMVNGGLTQFCGSGAYCLPDDTQTAAAGAPVVAWIAGDRSNEGDLSDPTKYFRQRTTVLGDIVDSEAVYVKLPTPSFGDAGFNAYKTSDVVKNRPGMVYVGANDGMLHAFRADTGEELWAYVPATLLPKLYKLVDKGYASKHTYFADGTPVVRDFYDGTKWRTLLVAGLGAGGRAYYAIDVTDPSDPQPLWEFTNDNLGYTFGQPEIVKLASGEWVVIFASGYNNVSPGDGVGRLFVLNALSGAAANGYTLAGISTGAGSTGTPSGLAQIRAWADNPDTDPTIQRIYGGDGYGYLWRFDVNGTIGAPGIDAQRLATLKTSTGVGQPITTRPELGLVDGYAMIYVGTGRYIGLADIGDATQQTIYAIKDRLTASDWGDPRATANAFIQQTLSNGTCPAGVAMCTAGDTVRVNNSSQAINLATNGGWYVDLPTTYERDNTDPVLVQGMLVVNTNVIDNTSVCSVGGSSWQNYFDYRTGGAVANSKNVTSVYLGSGVATRVNIVNINGRLYAETQLGGGGNSSSGGNGGGDPGVDTHTLPQGPGNDQARRTSWRELTPP